MSGLMPSVEIVSWHEAEQEIRALRESVFVHEQGVPVELEWDGRDPACAHALARNERGQVIGTGRLQADGTIGRLAVLKEWRGRGLGATLLRALLEEAVRRALTSVWLAAQVRAIGFYEKFGFQATGEIFDDAGIPHRTMVLSLSSARRTP